MTASNLEAKIMHLLVSDLAIADEGELEPDTNLLAGGYLDSITAMRFVHLIETELNIKIPAPDLLPQNFQSVSAIVSYLGQRSGD